MKICNFLMNIKYYPKDIFTGIKNLWVWFPIIWKDRNYDYRYLIDINIKKMEEMKKWYLTSNNVHVTDETKKYTISKLSTAIKLMKLVYDEHYLLEYQKQLEDLYGKSDIIFVPLKDNNELSEMKVKWEKNYSEEELRNIQEHEHQLFLKSIEKHKKAKRILWKFIDHNLDGWWD